MTEQYACPHCGRENDAAQRYCGACGRPLVLTCDACSSSSPLDFRFCGNCGAELRRPGAPLRTGEERRVVSVVFADIAGFTSRAERLDPEDVQAILTPYYSRLKDEIEAFGGTVEKFIGDAVMGVFGAPVAHGDDPERAVRAALRIREAVAEMNQAHPDLDLQVRIAVNTGEAIVALGARTQEGESMVAGDVVNTASRLQTAAPVDSVLVGEETYRCTRSAFSYEEVEPVTAKGKRAPVAAWLAIAPTGPPGERAGRGVPMVGREQELGVLSGIWEHVGDHRHAHLVTVFGPPGIGKTRLALEFLPTVDAGGGRTLLGRSLPYRDSGPYGAFAQQVKQVASIFDNDSQDVASEKMRAAVADLLGPHDGEEVASHLAILLGLGGDEDVSDRQVLFYSARRFVEALAARQPTVLLFQDLHWADPSLLDLIELLASRVREAPVLFLTLARADLLSDRPAWGSAVPAYTALPLEALDETHSHELASRLLAQASTLATERTAADLAEAGEGNPLFIEELVASLSERASTPPSGLPTSIRGIVAARLDGLPPDERSALLDASVVGKIFWTGALSRLGQYGDRLAGLLDSLEGRDLIRREAESRLQGQQQFRFKHMVIRDVAYATLPRARRREAHAAVAAFLEDVTAEGESTALLGHHWREAGDPERAVAYLEAAADQASRGWAKEEALRLYLDALALVPETDQESRKRLRVRAAVARQMSYHIPDAERLARADRLRPGGNSG